MRRRPAGADQSSSWHGTHVAGTVAAVTNNSAGVAGVAFGAKVLPVRVLGKCGGYTSDIAAGIIWASGGSVPGVPANATPARVINLSLGGSGRATRRRSDAINSARSRGTVVVVAAGNSSDTSANFSPASCAGVITVAATDRSGARAYYSNFGAAVAVAAPGGDMRASAANGILSTPEQWRRAPGADSLRLLPGHLDGHAARGRRGGADAGQEPGPTPDEVAARLKSSARPVSRRPARSAVPASSTPVRPSTRPAGRRRRRPPPPPPPPSRRRNQAKQRGHRRNRSPRARR